jgi:hypothetical protein
VRFFSKKVLTLSGVREFFVRAFMHVGTRRVFVRQPAVGLCIACSAQCTSSVREMQPGKQVCAR